MEAGQRREGWRRIRRRASPGSVRVQTGCQRGGCAPSDRRPHSVEGALPSLIANGHAGGGEARWEAAVPAGTAADEGGRSETGAGSASPGEGGSRANRATKGGEQPWWTAVQAAASV